MRRSAAIPHKKEDHFQPLTFDGHLNQLPRMMYIETQNKDKLKKKLPKGVLAPNQYDKNIIRHCEGGSFEVLFIVTDVERFYSGKTAAQKGKWDAVTLSDRRSAARFFLCEFSGCHSHVTASRIMLLPHPPPLQAIPLFPVPPPPPRG